mmetsp:Transcript_65367/g.121856  ORF Transcript_65367/g.121856 Transcript_65367/m.121856 type:complete len:342 (-) Transcript_65367:234-1259(-)
MVRDIRRCFCCRQDLRGNLIDHSRGLEHAIALHKLLRVPSDFNRWVQEEVCMDSGTRALSSECLTELQHALRPVEVHLNGSMGKSTALRGEHDMDVVVVCGMEITRENMQHMKEQLQDKGFQQVSLQFRPRQPGRNMITASFKGLALDILPVQNLSASTWADGAVRSKEFFRHMLAWKKHVVCALKAVLRLRFDVPGVLLETVVHSMPDEGPGRRGLRDGFLTALKLISSTSSWQDPCSGKRFTDDDRVASWWPACQEHCEEVWHLQCKPADLSFGPFGYESLPLQHDVSMLFGLHRYRGRMHMCRNFVELVDDLGLPRDALRCIPALQEWSDGQTHSAEA